MYFDRPLLHKNYFISIVLLIGLTAGMSVWMGKERLSTFHGRHLDVAQASIQGVQKEVSDYIAEKVRLVSLFAGDHVKLIRNLAADPDNDILHDLMAKYVTRYFPDSFAFSIANNKGEPLFEDFDGLVSELCVTDINVFAQEQKYLPYVHPNPIGYHFDIMVHYGEGDTEGVLFVSFLADVLGNIVKNIQSPGHKIMLIYPQRDNLIEIVAEGARNHWIREDYRLSQKEMSQINVRHPIAGTRWEAVNFHNDEIHNRYKLKILFETSIILVLFFVIAIKLVTRLRKEEVLLEHAERQKAEMMGVVSHEFKTPTSVIKNALELVVEGDAGEINSDVKKYINMALYSTSQLLLLVNDFLDLQQLDSGSLTLNKQKMHLNRIVKRSIDGNKMYASQFNVTYRLLTPAVEVYVLCDERRIEQILTNLLSNAAKYGCQDDVVDVMITLVNKVVRVSIADHGQGIAEEFQERVFERFAMENKVKNLAVTSTGLGLSIAKAIAEQHDGDIGFDTEVGRGTTFWFELPFLSVVEKQENIPTKVE